MIPDARLHGARPRGRGDRRAGRHARADRHARAGRRARALTLAVLIAVLALPPASAQLDTGVRDRLQDQAEEYQDLLQERRDEIARLEAALGDTRSELQARIQERDQMSARIAQLATQEADLQERIAELDAQVAETEARIAAEEANLDALKDRIRALLVNLHRQRAGRSVSALAGSNTLHDLRVQNRYLSMLSEQDVRLVREVDAQLASLSALRADLTAQRAELAANRNDLVATRQQQEASRAALQGIIQELDATEAGQRAQRVALLEAEQRLERELADTQNRLQREIERLAAEERRLREEAERFVEDRARREALEREADRVQERRLALTSPQAPNPAGFVAPLDEGVLVSRYGEGNNSFVALRAAEPGAPVYAVQGGVVIAAQSIGANDGWMVAIRHDAELATVYTNLREPPLQVGDTVQRGEVIGHLGGGTLPPPDMLRLYARLTEGGREAFVDPLPLLGL